MLSSGLDTYKVTSHLRSLSSEDLEGLYRCQNELVKTEDHMSQPEKLTSTESIS